MKDLLHIKCLLNLLSRLLLNSPTARSEGTDNLGENDVIYVLSFEFLGGCPFASKAKDDIEDMMTQSSVDHPITHGKYAHLYSFQVQVIKATLYRGQDQ